MRIIRRRKENNKNLPKRREQIECAAAVLSQLQFIPFLLETCSKGLFTTSQTSFAFAKRTNKTQPNRIQNDRTRTSKDASCFLKECTPNARWKEKCLKTCCIFMARRKRSAGKQKAACNYSPTFSRVE